MAELHWVYTHSVSTGFYLKDLKQALPVTSAVIHGGLSFGFLLFVATDPAVLGQLVVVVLQLVVHSTVIYILYSYLS